MVRHPKNLHGKESYMDELSAILAELLESVKNTLDIPQSSFKLWFDELELKELDDTSATFTTSSTLKKNILSNKYRSVIKTCLEQIIGFEVEIHILSREEYKVTSDVEPTPEPPRKKSAEEEEKIIAEIINSPTLSGSIIENYTFENFVEGSTNEFAKAVCYAVAREPNTYNPLFIYGNSGLGKTHLLYAVINYMKRNHPGLNIVYKKCETFLDELIASIKRGDTEKFKERYRSADVLLIDDIQFLAGKEQTQEEFFNTFNALYESDKQIILTSDRPPKEIEPLSDRLRTRFEGGLLADVQPPSFELRIAIIRKKADNMGLNISGEFVEYLAERLHNNIRQIEGVLKRLYAITSFSGIAITKEKIDEVISVIDPGNIPTEALIEKILAAVSRAFGVPAEDIKSKKKTASITNARHVAIYVIKKLTDLTLKQIGAIFNKDHSTVSYSLDLAERNIRTVNNYDAQIKQIIKEVKGDIPS